MPKQMNKLTAEDFQFENWLRKTGKQARVQVLAHFLKEILPNLRPDLFPSMPQVFAGFEQGWSNMILHIRTHLGRKLILRIRGLMHSSDADSCSYHKEVWAMRQVQNKAPVAGIIEEGLGYFTLNNSASDWPKRYIYMLQPYLPFKSAADEISPRDQSAFIFKLGQIAKQIHSVPCRGYGYDFISKQNSFKFNSWSEFLSSEIEKSGLKQLANTGSLDRKAYTKIRNRLSQLNKLACKPLLFHQDYIYNWNNILVDQGGETKAVIDWEFAGSGPALHYEIASTLYAMKRDGRQHSKVDKFLNRFLEGYGLSPVEYQNNYKFDVETLEILYAIRAITKFNRMKENKLLHKEPWRKRFALRAQKLIQELAAPKPLVKPKPSKTQNNLEEAA
jgi:aminoglycoside phosphotransferase (APT) family kinase protein